jgi:hypothetical protein
MIFWKVENSKTGEVDEYLQENDRQYWLRTRLTPYAGECFQVAPSQARIGSQYGTLICDHKTGEVTYRNDIHNIEGKMHALKCTRVIR